jgi:hypothetical protein
MDMDSDDEFGHPVHSAGYHPSQPSSPQLNASKPFGRSEHSLVDASRPFAQAGAVPAGFAGQSDDKYPSTSKGYGAGGDPFDDDEEGPAAYSFSEPNHGPYARHKRTRWQGIKEDYLMDLDWTFGVNALLGRRSKFDGVPREISLNDPEGNRVKGFEGNAIATGKYGPITFLPKFLLGSFQMLGIDVQLMSLSQPSSLDPQIYSSCSQVRRHLFVISGANGHSVHTTGAKRLTHGSIHDDSPPGRCSDSQCFQGDTRRLSEECWD